MKTVLTTGISGIRKNIAWCRCAHFADELVIYRYIHFSIHCDVSGVEHRHGHFSSNAITDVV